MAYYLREATRFTRFARYAQDKREGDVSNKETG